MPSRPVREYRCVGGEKHGHTVLTDAGRLVAYPGETLDEKLAAAPEVIYEVRSFAAFWSDAKIPLRIDVLMAPELCRALERDPKDGEVAWRILDAFMADLPHARQPNDGTLFLPEVTRALREGQAALKRARRALPKEPRGGVEGTAAWYAENGITRLGTALERIEDAAAAAKAREPEA